MFDDARTARPEGSSALDPCAINAMRAQLSAALDAASGLDDAGRVDAIGALERLGCVVTAAQAHLSLELDESRRDEHAAAGEPEAHRGRGVAHEVARARRESPHRAQRHLGLAKATTELPHTWRAWSGGYITEWKATLIARETACLTRDERLAVDRHVAADPRRLESMSVREVVASAQAEGARLDPAAVVARRRHAEGERRVTLRPAPDTMTWLTALLPVKDGVAVYAALTAAADSARAAGDPRGKGQVMADTLVGRALGDVGGEADGAGEAAVAPRVTLNLVMTDDELFGSADDPAYLEGYGPMPAELARELVAGACSREERIWLRRLYRRPGTDELMAADSRSRLFRGSLARFIRLRDQVCRTPWCDAPVRHIDHAIDRSGHGATSIANGQGLCESCNHAKQAPGWQAGPSPDADGHEIVTTLPTGHRYRSRPPPVVARIRRTPIRLEYALVG